MVAVIRGSPQFQLVLEMFHKTLARRVMIHNRNIIDMK